MIKELEEQGLVSFRNLRKQKDSYVGLTGLGKAQKEIRRVS